MWAGWAVPGASPVTSTRTVNASGEVAATVTVPAALLPFSGASLAVRAGGDGDAACVAFGDVWARAWALEVAWPPQAARATVMMDNASRLCIRLCPCSGAGR